VKCPSCAYENDDDALCCNLCSIVLKKESKPEPAPAPAPAAAPGGGPPRPRRPPMAGEPAQLAGAPEINALFLLALKKGQENQFPVSEVLMARLYQELDAETGGDIVAALGEAWLKTTSLGAEDKQKAVILLKATEDGVRRGDLRQAMGTGLPLMALARDPTAEGAKFALALLGIKGAAAATTAPMPAGAPPVAEPVAIDSQDAMKAVFTLAEHNVFARHVTEATRLMTRLVTELPAEDVQTLVTLSVEAWLKTEAFPREKLDAARAAAVAAAAAVGRRDFGAAHHAMAPVVRMITRAEPGPGFKMTLLVMGLKGAAEKKPAAAAAPSVSESAPPPAPGAANKPRF
jgi:hypothetical protein